MTIATSNKDTKQFARVYSFFIFSSCSSFPCIALTVILIIIWMQPQWLWSNSNAIFHGLGSPSPSFWKKAPRNSHPVQSGLHCIWFGDALWSRWWWSCWRERAAQQSTRSDLDGRSAKNPSGLWLSATYWVHWLDCHLKSALRWSLRGSWVEKCIDLLLLLSHFSSSFSPACGEAENHIWPRTTTHITIYNNPILWCRFSRGFILFH